VAIRADEVDAVEYYKHASNLFLWPTFKQVGVNQEPYYENLTQDKAFFSLKYNVICDIDNFVCQRIDLFTYAFLYKLGIEFYKERLGSDRFNRYTLLNRETTMEKMQELEKEYNQLMANALEDTRVDYDGVCFECADKYTKKFSIP
jgi:hypothetical protein